MKCSLCGYEFTEMEAHTSCSGCPFSKGCNMVRCPNCRYENPGERALMRINKRWSDRYGAK